MDTEVVELTVVELVVLELAILLIVSLETAELVLELELLEIELYVDSTLASLLELALDSKALDDSSLISIVALQDVMPIKTNKKLKNIKTFFIT